MNEQAEMTPTALRFSIWLLVKYSREALDRTGCHPDRWDDSHYAEVARCMGYVKALRQLLAKIETQKEDEGGTDNGRP